MSIVRSFLHSAFEAVGPAAPRASGAQDCWKEPRPASAASGTRLGTPCFFQHQSPSVSILAPAVQQTWLWPPIPKPRRTYFRAWRTLTSGMPQSPVRLHKIRTPRCRTFSGFGASGLSPPLKSLVEGWNNRIAAGHANEVAANPACPESVKINLGGD